MASSAAPSAGERAHGNMDVTPYSALPIAILRSPLSTAGVALTRRGTVGGPLSLDWPSEPTLATEAGALGGLDLNWRVLGRTVADRSSLAHRGPQLNG